MTVDPGVVVQLDVIDAMKATMRNPFVREDFNYFAGCNSQSDRSQYVSIVTCEKLMAQSQNEN